ncbi:hypothetical protein HPB52_017448 [Rhipicephalus sanguineus]|uniref:UBC core domain-containing protein n=1 Tax=Rhipicephalus sanguineus TaxID=34632 RepID=A0A9D4SPF0_RHISA|nr:hypothetical protein HPB52_017448 [Rhipicephalus sanguineus]
MGPAWSPALTIEGVLVSIQSMLNDYPYYNDPSYEKRERIPGEANRYNEYLRHETIRVAVCDQGEAALDATSDLPALFREKILERFVEAYDSYENSVKDKLRLTGQTLKDDFTFRKETECRYEVILSQLRRLRPRVKENSGVHI